MLKKSPFLRLLGHVMPHRAVLILAVALMVAESAIALAYPWLAGRFGGLVLDEPDSLRADLIGLMLLWGALLVAQSVLGFGNRYLLGITGERMLAGLRTRLYDHLQSLPLDYFHQRRRGEVLALLGNDAARISNFVTSTVVSLLPLLLIFAGAFVLMFRISPEIALLALVLVPLFFLVMKLIGRRLRPLTSDWIREHARMFANLEENLGMLPAIKSFNRERLESDRFEQSNLTLMRIAQRQLLVESILSPAVRLCAGLGLLALLFLAAAQLQVGELRPEEVITLLLYAMLMTRPISGLAGVYGSVQTARGAAERLIEAFSERPEPDDRGARELGTVSGTIRFDGVSFAYPGGSQVLHALDLEIRAGETVAITGENGSGKSTLIHLLMRFADPAQGRILIDGTDIQTVRIASLRRRIGLVAQQVLLFNGSLRDNIAYGEPGAELAAIEQAARAAQAHEFIMRLPNGYDTPIGDQGIRLSGGQRQRLSLARALLKDPPILILDEATAMFDPAGELAFLEECREVLASRTVIVITHRPASLALANRVVKMASVAQTPDGRRGAS